MGCIISDESKRWPDNTVPYTIAFAEGTVEYNTVLAAIYTIQEATVFKFVPRTTQNDYVEFSDANNVCNSSVGRIGGKQGVQCDIGPSFEKGSVMHEILHALGCNHEQCREDREVYVHVYFENIQEEHKREFIKENNTYEDIGAYDFDSLMHYHSKAYSANDAITIGAPSDVTIGQRTSLSPGDIATVNYLGSVTSRLEYKSYSSPSITNHNGRLFLVWRDVDDNIRSGITINGSNFFNVTTLNEQTRNAPATASFNTLFYVAWRGKNTNNIHICSTSVGEVYDAGTALPLTTTCSPTLAVFGNRMYLAWKDDASNNICIANTDGSTTATGAIIFSSKFTLPESTRDAPSLTAFRNKLYLAWRSATENKILVASSSDGLSFTDVHDVGETSNIGPCIHSFGNKLYLAWQSEDPSRRINIKSNPTGESFRWINNMRFNQACDDTPVIANLKGSLIWACSEPSSAGSYLMLRSPKFKDPTLAPAAQLLMFPDASAKPTTCPASQSARPKAKL